MEKFCYKENNFIDDKYCRCCDEVCMLDDKLPDELALLEVSLDFIEGDDI